MSAALGPASKLAFDPWHTLVPGPVAVLTHPAHMRQLMRTLRAHASRHDDTAWVHPNVVRQRDPLASLGQDLLDSIGAVGLAAPRAVGERHLLRALTHLVHGPARHVIVDDARLLPTATLTSLQEAALVGQVQLWLLIDTADGITNGSHERKTTAYLGWVNDACTVMPADEVEARWRRRPVEHPHCRAPEPSWWLHPVDNDLPLPLGCPDHANLLGSGHIDCLLAHMRRALTAGHLAPGIARRRLLEYLEHPDITVNDRWAATAASRDFITPGTDALRLTHPGGPWAQLGDVTPDGATLTVKGDDVDVAPAMHPAVARLRTSRRLAGCLDHELMWGLFDQTPGMRPRNARQ